VKPALAPGEKPAATSVTLQCHNCGHDVIVSADDERAACRYCSNVWNWKTKQLIRGQRGAA
jgi:ribosomal protein S27AE